MARFGERVATFLDEFFALDPIAATQAGNHAHDGEWPAIGAEGHARQLEFAERWERELRAGAGLADAAAAGALAAGDEAAGGGSAPVGGSGQDEAAERTAGDGLTPGDRIDRDLLLGELDAMKFEAAELRSDVWDPMVYVYMLGDGIFLLLAREFAPLEVRLASVASRLEGIPAVLDAGRRALAGGGARPVSRFHVETALKQLPGVTGLVDEAVSTAEAPDVSAAVREGAPRLRAAADRARAALDSFGDFLREDVLPRSEGEGRLGPELFDRKLRHTFKTALTAGEIEARAQREVPLIRAEMLRLARASWERWLPGTPLPTAESEGSPEAADQHTIRDVLSAIGRGHPQPAEMVDYCRAEYDRIVAFCRTHDVIDVPDDPLEITWTPPFLREFGGAMLIPPGPLDVGEKTIFCITPPDESWTPDQVESYLAENNDRTLRLLTIHEATPGHYLQSVYGNRCPSIVRSVFWSGVYAEGWAVYVTQVMMDAGYGADDPALMLMHWRFYLRAVINAIIDVAIHTRGMTESEALDLMIGGGFQEETEARKKWDRARLTSTQLSTYYVGSLEFWDLERERRVRAAVASGAGAATIPGPRIVGGYGSTPGFSQKEHLEAVLAHGSPPMPLLRRILLG